MSYFNAVCKANAVGDGTVGELVSWLEKFVSILFPDNSIEYWADNQYTGKSGLKRTDSVPAAGLTDACVHHVACYVREGSNEGRIIEILFYLRSGDYVSLTWAKTFGSADESWSIARAVDEALTSLIFFGDLPELVTMANKLPRAYRSARETTLKAEITVLSSPDSILVSSASGLVLDARSWAEQGSFAGDNATAVAMDWVTVLTNMKANFRLVKDQHRLIVADLPGYVISNRGVEGCTGFYVLPPGGKAHDDRDYLGYFPSGEDAIAAARDHQARHLPVAA
ncbi:MAG: hypothetical protein FD131_4977 [Rhodocyclaceae bacterium]|nr:MAG: hypothetical protein FD131_4977 [Rhodocyclaceae bacterium]